MYMFGRTTYLSSISSGLHSQDPSYIQCKRSSLPFVFHCYKGVSFRISPSQERQIYLTGSQVYASPTTWILYVWFHCQNSIKNIIILFAWIFYNFSCAWNSCLIERRRKHRLRKLKYIHLHKRVTKKWKSWDMTTQMPTVSLCNYEK